jgi:filamentous hemagglutinin family protein
MKQAATHLWIASSIALGCLVTLSPTTAQIVPDNTLPVNSIVTPGCTVCTIDGGTIRGSNLFHSFSEFSVPTGGGAFFNNGLQIQNILTRVTGKEVSNIDGLIRANGTANLFLVNPNGISFGANATLNLGGSFFASTASSLVFADGTVFSAKPDTSTPPLLTISVPLGLQYGSNPGSIQVQGAFLGVGVGQTLALVGGNVQLNGAALYTPVAPPGGRVELGGLAGEGTVGLIANGSYLGLSFPVGVPRGDVSLSNGAVVDVTAGGGGSIGINASNLTITQGSQLLAGIVSDSGAVDAVAGDIEINATGAIDLTDESYIFNNVLPGAKGQGGDVNITTSQLRVSGGSQVGASTFGQGDGGNLTVNASKGVQLIGTSANGRVASGLFASAEPGSSGKAGDLTINTDTLLVRDGAQVSAGTSGEGDGGNLTVNASQDVQLIGTSADGQIGSGLFAQANRGASGNAGELTINTDTLLVRDGSQVGAGTSGEGDGGNLTVNASTEVQLIGTSANGRVASGLFASAARGSSGKAGDLTINTDTLLVRDGAQVGAGTFGAGNGGNLTVNAAQDVQVIGESADGQLASGLFTQTDRGAKGKAGDLTINTGTLLVRDGALVSSSTFGEGDGGNLTVNASQSVQVIGTSAVGRSPSGLGAPALLGASGKAGDLTINTGILLVRDGALVSSSTFGEGGGGNLTVNSSQGVQVIGTSADGQSPSGLRAEAQLGSSGKAGDLTINTGTLLVRDGAQVGTPTFGQGDGGNLRVNASQQVQLIGTTANGRNPSGLAASAEPGASGKAGDLTINTDTLLVRDGAVVSVRSVQGQAGNMKIFANSLLLNRGTLFAVTAESGAQDGANITLSGLDLLRMDNESLISANALDQANGGNVIIDSTFIVAMPPTGPSGSDITANAGKGNGGAVNVTTQGVYGIEFRPQLTPKNDITVTSEFGVNGTFQLITPAVDPTQSLTNLPTEIADASRQIVQNCRAVRGEGGEENKFIVTGRGGLPPSPNDLLQGESVVTNWVTLDSDIEKKNNNTPEAVTPSHPLSSQLVEAQGWVFNNKGQIVLTASSPTVTPQSEWLNRAKCYPDSDNSAVSMPDRD